MPNEIPAFFHNRSNYDYHFIIKELAKKSEEQFGHLGENTEKRKTFFPIEKEITNIDSATFFHYQILLIISQKEFIKLRLSLFF